MNMPKAIAILFALLVSSSALADCTVDEKIKVPEGTVNGPEVCQNGQWVPIKK